MKKPAIIGRHIQAHMLTSIILFMVLFWNSVILEVLFLHLQIDSSGLFISDHSCNGINATKNSLPFFDIEYSTLGGISLNNFLFISPSFSNFFKDDASVEGLIPSSLSNKSLYRIFFCLAVCSRINKFHFLLTISKRSLSAHKHNLFSPTQVTLTQRTDCIKFIFLNHATMYDIHIKKVS